MKMIKLSGILIISGLVSITNLSHAADIGHDDVEAIPASANAEQQKYAPIIRIRTGCDYQPAVDANGNTSGGLKASGFPNGSCSSMDGQIYVRSQNYSNGYVAHMYAIYMAKDHCFWSGFGGHRHDWENVVVWIKPNGSIDSVAYSAHGDYSTTTSPNMSGGTHPYVDYKCSGITTTHGVYEGTSTRGTSDGLISWSSLPSAAKSALINKDWGSAGFPIKDSNFSYRLSQSEPF